MAVIKKRTTNASDDVREKEPLYTVGENRNYWSHYGNLCGGSSEN
jgi:hypothetical protein